MTVFILILIVWFVGCSLFKSDNPGGQSQARKYNPMDHKADELAAKFVDAYRNCNLKELDVLSEDMIDLCKECLMKNDWYNFRKLQGAARETSWFYRGKRYRNQLLEDIIGELI